MLDAGCSASGMVYYLYKCYDGPGWDPEMSGKQIQGRFKVSDGFNQKASCTIKFTEKSLEEIQKFAPGIETIDKQQTESDEPVG